MNRLLTIFIFFFVSSNLFSQDTTITVTGQAKLDSLKKSYQREDSLKKSSSEADTLIDYIGEEMRVLYKENTTYLFGTRGKPAVVKYRDMTLSAYKITIKHDSSIMIAEGIEDTTKKYENPDSVKYIGLPIFQQKGEEPMHGFGMVYNMKTRKGRVSQGRTKHQGGFYLGDNIVRIKKNVFQIRDGKFTTCDKEKNPHFYFRGSKMKFKVKDKVVAKPVYLVVEEVPIFWLPFGVFPAKGGRRSGVIVPSYGSSQREGRYLRGIGYFFALSDYYDAKIMGDYYDKGGIMIRGDIRYKKRYVLNGNISGSYTKMTGTKRWDLRINHSHTVDPTLRITASGNFQSDKEFYKNFSLNRDERTRRRIYSSLQISKNWEGTKNSITINVSREEDLTLGNITGNVPAISFSRSSPTYLFKSDKKSRSKSKWYESINFRYNSNFLRLDSRTRTNEDQDFTRKDGMGIEHNLSFSAPQKIFKYISFMPSVRYEENWFNKYKKKYINEKGELIEEDVKEFAARRTFSSSFSLNTNLYGVFSPNIGPLKILRHKFTPTITFSYTPDFSDEAFGYYDTYTDTAGVKHEYDKFEDVVLGGRTPDGRRRSMSISLSNLLQAKTVSGDKENKFDILSMNLSTSYNFESERKRLGNLRTSIRLKRFANLDIGLTHSFYKYDTEKNMETDKYLWEDGSFFNKRFLRLTNFDARIGFRKKGGETIPAGEEESESREFEEDPQQRFESETGLGDTDTPWNLSMNFNFNLRKSNPEKVSKTFSASANFDIQLTKNWEMSYSGNYDLVKKKAIYHDFKFHRDLHCWELDFHWTPFGNMKGFYLVLRIKDPQFKDLKVEKRDRRGSAIGTFGERY